eukprot:6513962-Prymnesium_polylepis.1
MSPRVSARMPSDTPPRPRDDRALTPGRYDHSANPSTAASAHPTRPPNVHIRTRVRTSKPRLRRALEPLRTLTHVSRAERKPSGPHSRGVGR